MITMPAIICEVYLGAVSPLNTIAIPVYLVNLFPVKAILEGAFNRIRLAKRRSSVVEAIRGWSSVARSDKWSGVCSIELEDCMHV